MTPQIQTDLAELRAALAYHDRLHGPDGDCGESCKMVSINLLRLLMRAFDEAPSRAERVIA